MLMLCFILFKIPKFKNHISHSLSEFDLWKRIETVFSLYHFLLQVLVFNLEIRNRNKVYIYLLFSCIFLILALVLATGDDH